MLWEEAEKKYGKALIRKIRKSDELRGITVTVDKKGRHDIPEEDIIRAIRAHKWLGLR